MWAREAFGPLHGFICGWAYWVNNLVYYPSLIVFIGGNAAFVLGRSYLGLADDTTYQILFSLGGRGWRYCAGASARSSQGDSEQIRTVDAAMGTPGRAGLDGWRPSSAGSLRS